MRLMMLTFKKDVRRLWPAVGVTWVMLAVLANTDRLRDDWMASQMESWLSILLTMAWACVAALAVLEEPLVGEVNFWTTRPHKWPPLLGAKLLFAVLAIHLPLFFADLWVVSSREFSPADYLGPLLLKQLLFFGAVTLPSLALATLVGSFTHFVVAVFAIAAGLAILNGGFQGLPEFVHQQSAVRHAAVRILLAGAALVVLGIQYARRRAIPARVMAIAAGLVAASISAWLPARAEYVLHEKGPQIALRNGPPADATLRSRFGNMQPVVFLPITVEPGSSENRVHLAIVELEIIAANGARIQAVRPSPNRPYERLDLMAGASNPEDKSPQWLTLHFSPPALDRVRNSRVSIRGTAELEAYRLGETTALPAQGAVNVPNVGRCTSSIVPGRFSQGMLKVLCEAPRDLPTTHIRLVNTASNREWRSGLRQGMIMNIPGPHEAWLSPLYRSQTFFHLTAIAESAPGSQWLVPADEVAAARVEITPEIVTGRAVTDFHFSDVSLAEWMGDH